jgi:hypothetical protein
MSIPVIVHGGLTGGEVPLGTLNASPAEIEAACDLFGSMYIERMGLQYQRYVIGGYWPQSNLVRGIYAAVNPAPRMTDKLRAPSVTGNIGESLLSLVARRMLGASQMLDVLPLNVTSAAKCPDFRVRINPDFPASFQTATGANPTIGFSYWPAESKAIESTGKANAAVERALAQLGTYWYERRLLEPSVAGFGLVCCFIYKGTKTNPLQVIRLHVIVPENQTDLHQRIDHFRPAGTRPGNRQGFLSELATAGSLSRSALKNV